MRTMIILSSLFASWTAVAETQPEVEARYSPAFNQCMQTGDAAQGVTLGMMNCLGTEIDVQDARLNQAYKMVMARQSAAGKSRLRSSERAWIKQRNMTCKTQSDRDGGGTLSAITYNSCILDETIKRTIWLERYKT